jgi:methionyl aminopeptidase
VTIRNKEEHTGMRDSNMIACEVLDIIEKHVQPGVTTIELDRIAEDHIRSRGALPAFKGYRQGNSSPYPGSICASINEEVVHGIPGERKLKDGDILSVDVGINKDGYFGDSARTFAVGTIDEEIERLLKVTREALYAGIAQARTGNRVHDISAAIQEHVEISGYNVVRELVGHGIGRSLHEEPAVPNFGKRGTGVRLVEGMVLAIEPMVNSGTFRVRVARDGWTILTADGKPSAHYEHSVIVRNDEAEILSKVA